MVSQRRLIATATTDANGVATITYTGTGVGLIQFEAEVTASNVTYTSETIEIGDWLFYDTGFGDSGSWTVGSSITSKTIDENGTTLTITERNTSNSNQYTDTTFTGDFEAVVYVENTSSTVGVRFGVNSGNTRRYVARSGNTYLRLVRENGTTIAYTSTDGETWTQRDMNGTEPSTNTVSVYIGIYIPTGTDSMSFTYKNLVIKSI